MQNQIAKDCTQKPITMHKSDCATSKSSEGLAALHLFSVMAGRCLQKGNCILEMGGGGGVCLDSAEVAPQDWALMANIIIIDHI